MTDALMLSAAQADNILIAARIIREGGVVAIPTDTVYGLAASVFQEEAVRRVYRLKMRPAEARVPVLLCSAADITILAQPPVPFVWKLIDSFWPGAVTIVLPASRSAPKIITQEGGTVALRVPANKACLQLLQSLGEPVVGTSANRSGRPPATSAAEAIAQLPSVDAIVVDDEHVGNGPPSTIVEVTSDVVRVLRRGAVSTDAIRRAIGPMTPVEDQLPVEVLRR